MVHTQDRGNDFFTHNILICLVIAKWHRHIHPIETKRWGSIAPLAPPPPLPRPNHTSVPWLKHVKQHKGGLTFLVYAFG